MTTADGIAALLPTLPDVPALSAVDTVALAAAVRGLATEYAWEGAPQHEIDAVCDLRRKLHSLGSVLFQRRGDLPPAALIDIDTAARLIERAAIGAIVRAQGDGTMANGFGPYDRLLKPGGRDLRRLHGEHDWSGFAAALDECRAAGDVSLSALRARLDGEIPATQPIVVVPAEVVAVRSPEWVGRQVRGVLSEVRNGAEMARDLGTADVSTLDPAVAADLARGLWDQMLIVTRLYSELRQRGTSR